MPDEDQINDRNIAKSSENLSPFNFFLIEQK